MFLKGPSGNRQVTGTEIRAFADYLRKGLEIPKYDIDMPRYGAKVKQRHPYAVLFNRRANRIILNEVDLSMAVAREFNLRTVTVNLETHSLSEIVHLLENVNTCDRQNKSRAIDNFLCFIIAENPRKFVKTIFLVDRLLD